MLDSESKQIDQSALQAGADAPSRSEKVSLKNPSSKHVDVECLREQIIKEVQSQLDRRLDDNEKNQFIQKEEYQVKLMEQIEQLKAFSDEKIDQMKQQSNEEMELMKKESAEEMEMLKQ